MNATVADMTVPTQLGVELRHGVSLAPFTTMKVGGAAQIFAAVTTIEQMIKLVRWARETPLPYYILGGGSNILVSDAGIDGLVIYNRCRQVRIDEAPCCVFPRKHVPGAAHPMDDRPFLFAESGAAMAGAARTSIPSRLATLRKIFFTPLRLRIANDIKALEKALTDPDVAGFWWNPFG